MLDTDVSSPAAESSPAVIEVPTGSAEYTAWRMTGELPEAKPATTPKPAAAAAAKTETSGASEEGAEHASASEAETQQEKKPRSNAETRLNELLADLKRAGMSPSELKTFKREAQQAAPAAQPKPEQTAKPAETAKTEAPKKPDSSKFAEWSEYEAALDKYHEDVAEFKANKAIADFQAGQQQQAFQRELQTKFAEAKTRYGDEAEATIVSTAQTLARDPQIPQAVKSLMDASPVLTDLLYAMGSKPADLDAFITLARTNPAAAVRKMVVIEQLVTAELAKGEKPASETPERDESGKFTPPAKKVTQAPPPPREASGRAAPPADEVEAALAANDFGRFREAQNRRDLQRRRGQ